MLKTGILNPQINALLSRFRHTNTIVIADRGFPYWPLVETIDISLVDDIPRVSDVLRAVSHHVTIGAAWMAEEFLAHNSVVIVDGYKQLLASVNICFEPHAQLKLRVPATIGLIRTADTVPYGNIILESA